MLVPAASSVRAVSLAAALCALVLTASLSPSAPAQAQSTPPGRAASSLPSLGDGSDMGLSEERRLGDSIARSIYRDPDYLDDAVLVDYLDSLWQPLLVAARKRGELSPELDERLAWELMLSNTKQVNAFALPGGYLGVELGLVAVTDTPEELASVLAHEFSHVAQRHIARMLSRQSQQAPWILGAMILGALAASASSNVDVANAAIMGGQAMAVQNQLNFSRDMEREADRVGFGVLTDAGFDGHGFVSMFDKLQQVSRLNDDGSYPYLRSHPLSTERMADMRARLPAGAASAPVGPRKSAVAASEAAAAHAYASARARVLSEKAPERWRVWWQAGQVPQATPAERYAGALSALRLGERQSALALARSLRAQGDPQAQWVLDALWLEVVARAKAAGAPVADADWLPVRDAALSSDRRALVLNAAEAALTGGAPALVSARLSGWVVQHPRDAGAWQLLARAQQAQGRRLHAIRAEAEARAAQLDYPGAIERLKTAQALPANERTDGMELAIVDARLRALDTLQREEMKESARKQ